MTVAIASLRLLVVLTALALLTGNEARPRQESYCDIQYNYCIYYPGRVFEEADSADTGTERLRLYDRDQDITLLVTVIGDAIGYNFRRLYEQQALELQQQFPDIYEIESTFHDEYMEAAFATETFRLYYISYRMSDQLITISIRTPVTLEREAFERLRAAIYLTSNT